MTIKKLRNCDLSGFRLVIATASTANLGQFAADLIVNSLQLEKIALAPHESIPPMIGPSAYEFSSSHFTTASEVFVCEKEKFALLLIRTPITACLANDLISEIIQFVKSESMTEIVQLSSACSSEQHFIDRNPYEFVANDYYTLPAEMQFNKSSIEKIYGSGIAVKLHEAATSHQIPSIILYKFTSEGENTLESIEFCGKIGGHLLGSGKLDIKVPVSWKHMFGFNVNREIY